MKYYFSNSNHEGVACLTHIHDHFMAKLKLIHEVSYPFQQSNVSTYNLRIKGTVVGSKIKSFRSPLLLYNNVAICCKSHGD